MPKDIYNIPTNFATEGTVLNGRVRTRNAAEALVLVIAALRILLTLNLEAKVKIYAGIIVIIPIAIFGTLGILGESLTSFLAIFIRYQKRRRILTVPDYKYRLKRNRRLDKQFKQNLKRKGGVKRAGKRNRRSEKETPGSETSRETAAKATAAASQAESESRDSEAESRETERERSTKAGEAK